MGSTLTELSAVARRWVMSKPIASALFISVATVKTHVSHILAKLGLESRVRLASWVAGHDLDPPTPARG